MMMLFRPSNVGDSLSCCCYSWRCSSAFAKGQTSNSFCFFSSLIMTLKKPRRRSYGRRRRSFCVRALSRVITWFCMHVCIYFCCQVNVGGSAGVGQQGSTSVWRGWYILLWILLLIIPLASNTKNWRESRTHIEVGRYTNYLLNVFPYQADIIKCMYVQITICSCIN